MKLSLLILPRSFPEWLFLGPLSVVKPYHTVGKSKKEEVELMFDRISGSYDLLNKILSVGRDGLWRRKALKKLMPSHPKMLLDVATGTGDLAFMADRLLKPESITGIDLSAGMLEIANKRLTQKQNKLHSTITFLKGDAESLPFQESAFDAACVAFGVRNFAELSRGLMEMHRVLRPGAPLVVLEFTKPRYFPFKQLFYIYFKYILPLIGSWTSGDRRAYHYLFESVQSFPDYEAFNQQLIKAGFVQPSFKSLSFGICAIYLAYKS